MDNIGQSRMGPARAPVYSIRRRIKMSDPDWTDSGGTYGTLDLKDKIPAGSIVLGWAVYVDNALDDDTNAYLVVGTSSDLDRFNPNTDPNLNTAGYHVAYPANVADAGDGDLAIESDTTVRLTVTGTSDFTKLANGDGSFDFELWFIKMRR